MMNSASARNRRYLPSSPFKPPPEAPPAEQYELDDMVTHEKYGLGRVILVEVPESAADDVVAALRQASIKGRRTTIRRERYPAR